MRAILFLFLSLHFALNDQEVAGQRSIYRYSRKEDGSFLRVKSRYRSPYISSATSLQPVQAIQNQNEGPIGENEVPGREASVDNTSQIRAPRKLYYLRYTYPPLINGNGGHVVSAKSRRLRSDIPDVDSIPLFQQDNQEKQRILGWLFGRPNYSPYSYPDYSPLENAAGIGRYPYSSRLPPSYGMHGGYVGGSPYVVEECTELLDPYTHEVIEDCYEVPVMH